MSGEVEMNDLTYLTSHYDEKIKRINEINAPLNFIFITDMHNRLNEFTLPWSKVRGEGDFELAVNAIHSMQYIIDRCPGIDCVISGGDVCNDYHPDPLCVRQTHKEISDALYSLSVPVHCCIGNHDDAVFNPKAAGRDTKEFAVLPDELHELYMKNNPTDKNYYYKDFDDAGFRFIFLNTSDLPYFTDHTGQYFFGSRAEISEEQAIWFEQEALNTDKRIILFAHVPVSNTGICGSEGLPNPIKPYDDVLNAPRINYDIKKADNITAMIFGHVHYDNLFYNDNILTVTTLSAFADTFLPTSPKREFGTYTETAFDVFSIKDNIMYITRFGAGEDRKALLIR